jgi:Flp pilus assembly protein TadG
MLKWSRAVNRLKPEHDRRGGAALELAVVFPFLVLLVIGVADFARAYNTAIAVANAASAGTGQGARGAWATVDTAAMTSTAIADASPISLDTVTSSKFCKCSNGTTPSCTGSCSGYGVPQVFVQVRVRKTYAMLFRYPGLPQSFPIVRTATIRIQ